MKTIKYYTSYVNYIGWNKKTETITHNHLKNWLTSGNYAIIEGIRVDTIRELIKCD